MRSSGADDHVALSGKPQPLSRALYRDLEQHPNAYAASVPDSPSLPEEANGC